MDAAAFHEAHRTRFGHADPGRPVEIVNVRVVGTVARAAAPWSVSAPDGRRAGPPTSVAGVEYEGPITIPLDDATVRIEEGWIGRVHETGAILVQKTGATGVTGEREDVRT